MNENLKHQNPQQINAYKYCDKPSEILKSYQILFFKKRQTVLRINNIQSYKYSTNKILYSDAWKKENKELWQNTNY